MLPTKGFFKDIDCPYHERTCGRPYCHFRHRKKGPESDETASTSTVPTYKPTPKSELASNRSHIPISYVPDIVSSSRRSSYNIKDRPTYKPTPKSVLSSASTPLTTYTPTPIAELKQDELNLDDLQHEFQLIDEILNDEGLEDIKAEKAEKEEKNQNNAEEKQHSKTEENKEKRENSDKHQEGRRKRNRKRSRRRTKSSENKKDGDSKIDNRNNESKEISKLISKDDKERSKDDKDKKKDDRTKSKEKNSSSSKSSSSKSESSKSKSASSKDKSRDRNKDEKYSSSNSSSSKNKSNDKDKKPQSSSSKNTSAEDVLKDSDTSSIGVDYDYDPNMSLDDDDNLMMIEDECFKIFNEYKAPVIEKPRPEPIKVTKIEPKEEVFYPVGKRRIAYNNVKKDEKPSQPFHKPLLSAGMTLQNRIKNARQAQASNEGQNIMQEMKNLKRAPAPIQLNFESKKLKPNGFLKPVQKVPVSQAPASTSLVDDIINNRLTSNKPRRIAPATNVMSIQMAKARIEEMKIKSAVIAAKTIAQTVQKGAKRTAHMPDTSLSNIPDVLHAEKSKLPVNVRTRYLGLLADECVKLYVATEEAYTRALNEEYKCYERCSALPTYRNSAMLAVNRLRKEIHERGLSGLGPLQIGESASKTADGNIERKRFHELAKTYMLSNEELNLHGFPRESSIPGRAIINNEHKQSVSSEQLESNQRICCRCHKLYLINREGFPLFEEECCYHPLRKRTIRGERQYLCCKSTEDTGCVLSSTHVSEVSADRELEGFQSTLEAEDDDDPRNYAVYALDCEMCYTTKGLELTRVTIVDSKLKTVFESLVKPFNPIIDYNTRFSGITPEHMEGDTKTILQIQATILHMCSAKTILIGHSLESDMKALKIIHNSIVDTSVIFPHKFGLPHKRALRVLASEYLKKIIQNDVGGHDSAEDALAAMELVLWKVKEDLKVKALKH